MILEKLRVLLAHPVAFIGVRAGGAGGAAAPPPPNFGQLRFFGAAREIWAKPIFKEVCMCVCMLLFFF